MNDYFICIELSDVSNAFSILTPIVLLVWFLYSQWRVLSKEYYNELVGVYAGFTSPIGEEVTKNSRTYAGVLMRILDVDSNGFFKGELDYGENMIVSDDNTISFKQIRDGIHTILGKLNYQVYKIKERHPYETDQNRIYLGKLYIVDRLDFLFDTYKFEQYLECEYDIIHYREMKVLKFIFNKRYKEGPKLPQTFTVHKHLGLSFEPSRNVLETVFRGNRTLHSR